MQRFDGLMLQVWREACRQIEIGDSTTAIAHAIARQLPISSVLVLQLKSDCAGAAVIAASDPAMVPPAEREMRLTGTQHKRLANWCKRGSCLWPDKATAEDRRLLQWLTPRTISARVMAASLSLPHLPAGIVLLTESARQPFGPVHRHLLEALREPFSVALANDHQLRELNALRAVAEADRGALLRRLGRKDLLDTIVGEATGLRHVMERIQLVARSDIPVLVLGETGTGKELVARALHMRSAHPEGPFIRVNCGAIPTELIDSQLFGHERGSFTGAEQDRQGWFERADGGTLFLDEIGELSAAAQVRFLRVLQDGYVERVGASRGTPVHVRVVAATHRDLPGLIRAGKFREDLWYRLATFPILLPPLRERRGDIPELARHFAERAAARFGLPAVGPSEDDLRQLQSYDWPGNIRELAAVIDRAAILGEGQCLEIGKALGTPWDGGGESSRAHRNPVPPAHEPFESLDEAMRRHIEAALRRTDGRIEGRHGAAAILRINPHTLRARMRKLGIRWSQFRPA